jgi:regulatory protein
MNEDYEKKKIRLTPGQALPRIQHFCAYQERCHQEVRDKLYAYSLGKEDVENIIATLISDNYLNEERFAQAFVSGKFRMKKWGRTKILQQLKLKKISEYCIKKGMQEIDPDEYDRVMRDVAEKKLKSIKGLHPVLKQKKVALYLISRGFESDLSWDLVKVLMKEQ